MENQTAAKQSKGMKKLWLKFKASMKTDQPKSSKDTSVPTTSKAATSTPVAAQTATTPVTSPALESNNNNNTTTQPATQPESKKVVEDTKSTSPPPTASDVIQVDDEAEDTDDKIEVPQMKSMSSDKEATALRYQRAQNVFKKYNLEIDPADWQQADNSTVPRVEKKTRMRVRYTCHECKQTFGREKKCSKCSHMRCDSCVRYPAKRTGDKGKQKMPAEAVPSTMLTPTIGACHACKTSFNIGATECDNCQHEICSRCLKETVMASPGTAPPPAQSDTVAAAS